jgi:hypothetical protein
MVHVSQKIRIQNLELVKKLIARSMPQGSRDKPLKAVLCTTYGFHPKTVNQYLTDLRDAERIVWDEEEEVWKLPEK